MDVRKSSLRFGRRTGTDILKDKVIRKDEDGADCFQDYWTDSDSADECSNSASDSHKSNFSESSLAKESDNPPNCNESDHSDSGKGASGSKQKESKLSLTSENSLSQSNSKNMSREVKKLKENVNPSPRKKIKLMKEQDVSIEENLETTKEGNLSGAKQAMNSGNSADSEIDIPAESSVSVSETRNLILEDQNDTDAQSKSASEALKTVSPLSKIINKTSILSPRRSVRNELRQTKSKNEMETEKILSNYDKYDALIMKMINENETGDKNQNLHTENISSVTEKTTKHVSNNKKSKFSVLGVNSQSNRLEFNQTKIIGEINHFDLFNKTFEKSSKTLPKFKNTKEISKNMPSLVSLEKDKASFSKEQTEHVLSLEKSKLSNKNLENSTSKSRTAKSQVTSLPKYFKPSRKNTSSPISTYRNCSVGLNDRDKGNTMETFEQMHEESSSEDNVIIQNSTRTRKHSILGAKSLKRVSKNQVPSLVSSNNLNLNASPKQTLLDSSFKSDKISKHVEKINSDKFDNTLKSKRVKKQKNSSKYKDIAKNVPNKGEGMTRSESFTGDLENHEHDQSELLTPRPKSPETAFSPYKTRGSDKKDSKSNKKIIPSTPKNKKSTAPIEKRKSMRLSQVENGEIGDIKSSKDNVAMGKILSSGSCTINSGVWENHSKASPKTLEQKRETPNLEDDFIKSKTFNKNISKHNKKNLRGKTSFVSFKSPEKAKQDGKVCSGDGFEHNSKYKVKKSQVTQNKGNSSVLKNQTNPLSKALDQNSEMTDLGDDFIKSKAANKNSISEHTEKNSRNEISLASSKSSANTKQDKPIISDNSFKHNSKFKTKKITKNEAIDEDAQKTPQKGRKRQNIEELNEITENDINHQSDHLSFEHNRSLNKQTKPVSTKGGNVKNKKKRTASVSTSSPKVRRSNRQRYLPLHHWRNERLMYRFENDDIKILGIDKGTDEDRAAALRVQRRQTKKIATMSNATTHPKTKKGFVYDAVRGKNIRLDLFKAFPSVAWDEPESSSDDPSYKFKRVFETPNSGFGFIEIGSRQSKPTQYMPDEDLQMTVIKGNIEVIIQENNFIARRKDMFIVPRGTAYGLKNLDNRKALLSFVIGKFKFLNAASK